MVGWPDRRFLDLVGTEFPIVQAPMAGAGGVDLCVAAIQGGALGSLPCALLSPEQVRSQAAAVRSQANGPLNLNFFCHHMPEDPDDSPWRALLRPYYEEFGVEPGNGGALRLPFDGDMCAAVEDLRPEVVSFHFGLPNPDLLDRVKATGAVVIGNATSVEEARWLESRSVDAIIAQGFEAGGHTGRFLGEGPAEAMAVRVAPADRRCRIGSRDRGGRHRRRSRDRGRLRPRRKRGPTRDRLSSFARNTDQRRASAAVERRAYDRHQPSHRRPRARAS
jgi:nitronate monooxygenase